MAEASQQAGDNWWLSEIGRLDLHCPGLAGSLLRGSKARRHVSAAALAANLGARSGKTALPCKAALERMASGRLHEVIADAYCGCPTGFVSTLRHMDGEEVQPPEFYRLLHHAYLCRPDVTTAIRHVKPIDQRVLELAMAAPPILLSTGAFRAARSVAQLSDLSECVRNIAALPNADQNSLAQSLKALAVTRDIPEFVRRRLASSEFPAIPLPGTPAIHPIRNGSDLLRAALRFSNCLRTFTLDILASREGFYICQTPSVEVVARIARPCDAESWVLVGVHEKQNRRPSRTVESWVQIEFAKIGIRPPRARPPRGAELQVFERLLEPLLYDFAELDFEV